MKGKTRLMWRVLIAMVLVISLSLVTAVPAGAQAIITVDDSGGKDFTTIQAAIDDAGTVNGDEIKVYPGTYTEELKINKEVTLTGVTAAGADNWTALTAGAGATAPTITYDGSHGHMIGIDANNVTFQGFNIDTTNVSATRAIHFRSQGAALTDNTIIRYNTFTGASRAINVSDDRTVTDLIVTYNRFTGDGTEWGNWLAIDSDAGISGTNVFSNNIVTGNMTGRLELGTRNMEDITWSSNSFSFGFTLTEDDSAGGKFGDLELTNNTFAGDPSTSAFEVDGTVEDLDWEGGACNTADVTIRYNDFSGYIDGGNETVRIVNAPTDPLNAEDNWWGSANGPIHTSNTFNVGSQGAADVGDNVDFVPWYNASMTGATFAPVNNTTQVTKFSSIQAAIDDAATTTGDTITAVAGTYTEDLAINEELTLTGRNLADTADAWTALTAGAASSSPTITYDGSHGHMIGIDANNVTFQGFNIDTTNVSAVRAIHFRSQGAALTDNTRIQYNTFTGASRAINVSDDRTVTDLTVTYNKFTGDGTEWGNWLAIDSDAGIWAVTQTSNVFSYNTVTGNMTGRLELGTRNMEDITWNNNSFSFGFVLTEDDSAGGLFGDIVLQANTFAGAPSTSAFEILESVEDVDWETGNFTADAVIIHYNDFSGYAVGGNETVRTETNLSASIDAKYNYWGSALDGPTVASNPNGTGADVGALDVDYESWLYYTTAANDGDTVANIVANEVPAYAFSRDLIAGWNTFSAPIGLDGQYNTWAELYDLTGLTYDRAYRFDPTTQTFTSLGTTSGYAIAPGEGFYIHMTSADSIPYCFSTLFSMPSRALGDGWNMIGGGMETRSEIDSCISIITAGGTAGYSHIVSPLENQSSWVHIAGATTDGDFMPGEGYWVFLPIDRTLGLFDPTPLGWVP